MHIGVLEIFLLVVYVAVVIAVIALPVWVLREMRRRGEQLDRIERRLDDLDRRRGPDPR
jgi:Flp pilus assembly protein TadB